jgi:hypothetical protein
MKNKDTESDIMSMIRGINAHMEKMTPEEQKKYADKLMKL